MWVVAIGEAPDASPLWGCAVVATLLNPFGFHAWTYALALSTNPVIRASISEWAPITLSSSLRHGNLTAAAIAGWLALRGEKTPWPDLVWLGVFFFLALQAGRGVIWWGLVAPVVVAGLLPARAREDRDRPARAGTPLLDLAVAGTLVLALVAALVHVRRTSPATLLSDAPQGLAAAAAAQVPAGSRLVVPEAWGSWFEYAVPSVPVFVDPRIELFPSSVWLDYTKLRVPQDGWREVLDRWHVDAIVVDTRDPQLAGLAGGGRRLAPRLHRRRRGPLRSVLRNWRGRPTRAIGLARPARTCCSTRTTPWTGTRGGRGAGEGAGARTSRSSSPSAIRPATGATSWSASRSKTRRSPRS